MDCDTWGAAVPTAPPEPRLGARAGRGVGPRYRRSAPALALAVLVALWGGPLLAADFCSDLRQRITANNDEAEGLVVQNPGSVAVFASCLAIGAGRYSQDHDGGAASVAYAGCAGIGCIVTDSYGNCISVNLKLFALALRNMQLADQARQAGCP